MKYKIRMVPVKTIFSRFPRLIRDLSKTTSKPLKLQIEGEETLLDDVDKESEVNRWAEGYRMRVLEAAIGNRNESFEDIMADLNKRWAAARKVVGAK